MGRDRLIIDTALFKGSKPGSLATYTLVRYFLVARATARSDRLDEFAGVVSHDLRNPLNVAIGRLELVQEECESEHLASIETVLDGLSVSLRMFSGWLEKDATLDH